MQMFLYNAFKMSVKFVSNLKKSEFDQRVRGLVFCKCYASQAFLILKVQVPLQRNTA